MFSYHLCLVATRLHSLLSATFFFFLIFGERVSIGSGWAVDDLAYSQLHSSPGYKQLQFEIEAPPGCGHQLTRQGGAAERIIEDGGKPCILAASYIPKKNELRCKLNRSASVLGMVRLEKGGGGLAGSAVPFLKKIK